MTRLAPGLWTSPDGYRIARHVHDDGWVSWRVYRPNADRHCADTAYLREARDVVDKMRSNP